MLKYFICMFSFLVTLSAFADIHSLPYPPPQPPQQQQNWSCSAVSETGHLFYSPFYTNQADAQNAALGICYQYGFRACRIYQCVVR